MKTITKNQLDHIGSILKTVHNIKKYYATLETRHEELYRVLKTEYGYSSESAEKQANKISARFFEGV